MAAQSRNIAELENASVWRLLIQYSLPSIAGMVVYSLYNIIDSVFIGHGRVHAPTHPPTTEEERKKWKETQASPSPGKKESPSRETSWAAPSGTGATARR